MPVDSTVQTSDCDHAGGALLLDGPATAKALGIGLSLLYNLDRSGQLGPVGVKLGARRLWPREELAAWARHGCPHRERWENLWNELRCRPDRP
jgi:predicted DNA-binding transcriptional regulator AlpA